MVAQGAMVAAQEDMVGAGADRANTTSRPGVAAVGAAGTGVVRTEAAAEAVGTEETGIGVGTPTLPSFELRRSLGSHPCAVRGTPGDRRSTRSRGAGVHRTGICRRPLACTWAARPLHLGAARRAGRGHAHTWGPACPRETVHRSAPAAWAARPPTRHTRAGDDAWWPSRNAQLGSLATMALNV